MRSEKEEKGGGLCALECVYQIPKESERSAPTFLGQSKNNICLASPQALRTRRASLTRARQAALLLGNLPEGPFTIITNYASATITRWEEKKGRICNCIYGRAAIVENKNYSCKNWKEALKMLRVIVWGWWGYERSFLLATCLFF